MRLRGAVVVSFPMLPGITPSAVRICRAEWCSDHSVIVYAHDRYSPGVVTGPRMTAPIRASRLGLSIGKMSLHTEAYCGPGPAIRHPFGGRPARKRRKVDQDTSDAIDRLVAAWPPLSDALKAELARVLNLGRDPDGLGVEVPPPLRGHERDVHEQLDHGTPAGD